MIPLEVIKIGRQAYTQTGKLLIQFISFTDDHKDFNWWQFMETRVKKRLSQIFAFQTKF